MARNLPYVKISFGNGNLGISTPMDDGCAGLIATAEVVNGQFELDKAYELTSLADLADLGITSETNGHIYKTVAEFYSEAPKGSKLWLMGHKNVAVSNGDFDWSEFADKEDADNPMSKLLAAAKGEIRILMFKMENPSGSYPSEVPCDKIKELAEYASETSEAAVDELYAPCICLFEAKNDEASNMEDLTERDTWTRIGMVVGDTEASSEGDAVGLVGGRLAAIPVQRCLARVRDGKIAASTLYIGSSEPDNATAKALLDKGYIVPRTFVGKTGFYWADDPLCCDPDSDYATIARRRVIDKAYRIAYKQCVELVGEEIAVNANGNIPGPVCKGIETGIVSAIAKQMTANGELATDPDDPNDLGVTCTVDPMQDIVSASTLEITVAVRPYGYAKYIEVTLGFQVG